MGGWEYLATGDDAGATKTSTPGKRPAPNLPAPAEAEKRLPTSACTALLGKATDQPPQESRASAADLEYAQGIPWQLLPANSALPLHQNPAPPAGEAVELGTGNADDGEDTQEMDDASEDDVVAFIPTPALHGWSEALQAIVASRSCM